MIHHYDIFYFIDNFNKKEILNLNSKINIIYRNYQNPNIQDTIKELKFFCKLHKRKLFLANNLKLATKYDLDGLYIPSFNKNLFFKNLFKKKNFKIIGSAHNIVEILNKEKQGCEAIFLAPIFKSPKNKYFLGINKFNFLTLNTRLKIIALGGINQKNVKNLYCTRSVGFASISWIKKNRPIIK